MRRGGSRPVRARCFRDEAPDESDAKMPLRDSLSDTWSHIQGFLFPMWRDEVGPLTDKQEQVVVVLDVARIEAFVHMWPGLQGRPPADRHAIARAFVAKAVLGLPQTNMLI